MYDQSFHASIPLTRLYPNDRLESLQNTQNTMTCDRSIVGRVIRYRLRFKRQTIIFKMNIYIDFSLVSANHVITNEYQKFDSVFKSDEIASLLFQAINVIGFTSKNFN